MYPRREYDFWVYIMASRSLQLYIGMTNSLRRRVDEHKAHIPGSYTARYNIDRLVYYEHFQYVHNAIAREKELKDWNRAKKLALIEEHNPTRIDLSEAWRDADSSATLRNDKKMRGARSHWLLALALYGVTCSIFCSRLNSRGISMLGTKLHWVNGPWRGKLAMAARPRGGDWLQDEIASWRKSGVATVVSLLEEQEERDLDLTAERSEAEKQGLKFISFPIVDRDVPVSQSEFGKMLETLHRELAAGQNVVLHCRQGIGRTGLVAACLLVGEGLGPQEAIDRLTSARGVEVPETDQQRRWIADFAGALATTR